MFVGIIERLGLSWQFCGQFSRQEFCVGPYRVWSYAFTDKIQNFFYFVLLDNFATEWLRNFVAMDDQ